MNYSQRKHIERLMADMPEPPYDPFSLRIPARLFGMDVIESKDQPRYTLPEEVIPGVPWPPGFRDDINAWSHSFLGTTNIIPRGTFYVIGNRCVIGRPSDVVKISGVC